MELSKIKYEDGRPYVEYTLKVGRQKGYIKRYYGEIIVCKNCNKKILQLMIK